MYKHQIFLTLQEKNKNRHENDIFLFCNNSFLSFPYDNLKTFLSFFFIKHQICLVDVKQRLQLDNELPLLVRDILAVKLLEAVDAGTADETVQRILLFELATVRGLVAAHFDLDGHGRLALFADRDLLVFSLDGGSVRLLV